MKKVINQYTNTTPLAKHIGTAVDMAVHSAFKGKVRIPLQLVLGKALANLNRHGLFTNNVLTAFQMDAGLAEQEHSQLIEKTINTLTPYLTGYGTVATHKTAKRGKWTTHWLLILDPTMVGQLEVEDRAFRGTTVKKLRGAKVQTSLQDKLGVNTEIRGLEKDYLEALSNQYVEYNLNIEKKELATKLAETYSEAIPMANGSVRFKATRHTQTMVNKHMECLTRLDGKSFPVTETLEPRGRTAKQQQALLGMNLYGKTWETQCFKLGEETVAWDARQSGYQILGGLLGSKALCTITGAYGEEGGDIYTEVFAQVLMRVFGKNDIERLVAKKPAQMLAYMAGMRSILLEDDLGLGSIWFHLAPKDAKDEDIEGYCDVLEQELWNQPELQTIMQLREDVRNGAFANYSVPSWSFPGTSEYFFSRSDTNFISFGKDGMHKDASIFVVFDDAGKGHQMTMHLSMIREFAKSSAILAAIIHSVDAFIKKHVTLDVIEAGGKILVKHDEFICDKAHEDVMKTSYHHWLAYVSTHYNDFLLEPLRSCGYAINLNKLRKANEEQFGKFFPFNIAQSKHGLGYEWTV